MERNEYEAGTIFLALPIMACMGVVGLVFLFLGVTVFPVIGIFMGLAIIFLGFKLGVNITLFPYRVLLMEDSSEMIVETP